MNFTIDELKKLKEKCEFLSGEIGVAPLPKVVADALTISKLCDDVLETKEKYSQLRLISYNVASWSNFNNIGQNIKKLYRAAQYEEFPETESL